MPAESRAVMVWAQRLKRVVNIDIETCSKYGGAVRVVNRTENPVLIEKIIIYLNEKAPPQVNLFSGRSGNLAIQLKVPHLVKTVGHRSA